MSSSKLSVIIITRNEERNIADCLQSVIWADEIVVVDSYSTDKTAQIAAECGAKVYQEEWRGFSKAKQSALDHSTSEWTLSLDADERITPELGAEIKREIAANTFQGFEIPRRTWFIRKFIRYSGWYPDYTLRLFKKANARFSESQIHERVVVDGAVGRLGGDILHYSYRSIEEYIARMNRYTTLAANELSEKGAHSYWFTPLVKAPAIFVKRYIMKIGFLDGWSGLELAALSAMYVFVKYLKLRELNKSSVENIITTDSASKS
ncbi:MAG: glycosyltransferase family 2 protein [candidate division Zixibacteria bacterium]|nr:glycosyltransferase family 2 protein [candidate division Zixibacteria bacterium]